MTVVTLERWLRVDEQDHIRTTIEKYLPAIVLDLLPHDSTQLRKSTFNAILADWAQRIHVPSKAILHVLVDKGIVSIRINVVSVHISERYLPRKVRLRACKYLLEIVGDDRRTYGPFKEGEEFEAPPGLASALLYRGLATLSDTTS